MSRWKSVKLGEVITLKRGYDLPNHNRVKGSVPVVSSSGITSFHNISKVKAPGVVTGRYGTIGEVFYIDKDFWPLNTTLYVEDFKGNNPRFISYFLKTLDFSSFAAKSAVPGINRNDLHLANVNIAKLEVQRKTVHILSAYDNLVENNNRRIEILEEMAQRLYREWFVHFRFPGYTNINMVESELGLLPESWRVGKTKELIKLLSGYAFKSKDFHENGSYKIVTIKNVQDGKFEDSNCNSICDIPKQMPHHCCLRSGDILVSLTGNVGRICLVYGEDYLLNQRVAKLYSDFPAFSYSLFRSDAMYRKMNIIANGVAQQNLSPIETCEIEIVIPPKNILYEYEKIANRITKQIILLYEQNSNLRKTRDLLLPRLISGDIDISDLPIPTEGGLSL